MPDDPKRKPQKKRLNDLRSQLDRLGYGPGGKQSSKVFSADDIRRTLRRGSSKKRRLGASPAKSAPCRTHRPTSRPRPSRPTSAPSKPVVYSRSLPHRTSSRPTPTAPAEAVHVELESAVAGTEIPPEDGGKLYLVENRVRDIEGAGELSERFGEALSGCGSGSCHALAKLVETMPLAPTDLIFMDVESAGLGNGPIFLVGVMVWTPDGLCVRQFLARNYAEERAMIGMFTRNAADRRVIVTFNGKSFDVPYLRARAAASGVPFSSPPAHLDLLHVCRRYWKDKLPNCKLQTLERFVCRRRRHDDIPGDQIPEAYHAYVRTGNAHQIVTILKHNMLDLVTLADLLTRLPADDT